MQDKIYRLEEQSKAYNMGMMGQLDGERAVMAEEQAAAGTTRSGGGGYRGGMSFSADNDKPMYVGLNDDDEDSAPPEELGDKTESQPSDLELAKDLMEKTRQFKLDERDPYLKVDIFNEKYSNGEMYNVWTNQLKELIGEKHYNDYMSNYDEWEIPEKIDTPEDIINEQTGDDETDEMEDSSNLVDELKEDIGNVVGKTLKSEMSEEELMAFSTSAEGRDFFKNQRLLESLIGTTKYERFMDELFGNEETLSSSEGIILEEYSPDYRDESEKAIDEIWKNSGKELYFYIDDEVEFSAQLILNIYQEAEKELKERTGLTYKMYLTGVQNSVSERSFPEYELMTPEVQYGFSLFNGLEKTFGISYAEAQKAYDMILSKNNYSTEQNEIIDNAMNDEDFSDFVAEGEKITEWSPEIAYVAENNGRLSNHDMMVVINNPNATKLDYNIKYLTENERGVLRYYYGKGDIETFEKYLVSLYPNLDKRQYYINKVGAEDFLDELGAGGKAISAITSIAAGTFEGLAAFENAYYGLKEKLTGEYIPANPYSFLNRPAVITKDMKDYTLEDFGEVGQMLGDGMFNFAETIRDVYIANGSKGAKSFIDALNTAGKKSNEALLSNLDYSEATLYAISNVLVNQIADKKFGDNKVLEGISKEAFKTLLDIQIRGDNSDYNQYIQELTSNGYSKQEAENKALEKFFKNILIEETFDNVTSTIKDVM